MILLIGAAGKTGSLAARNLAAHGHRLRALVRDPQAAAARPGPGLDCIYGDLRDPASLRPALGGVDMACLATAPSDLMAEQETTFIAAAHPRRPPAAGQALSVRHRSRSSICRRHPQIESALTHSGVPATCPRPEAFMTSLLDAAETVRAAQLHSTAEDRRITWTDTADVADVATTALLDPAHASRILQLTGPEALTCDQLAAAFARVPGHPVEHARIGGETIRGPRKALACPAG